MGTSDRGHGESWQREDRVGQRTDMAKASGQIGRAVGGYLWDQIGRSRGAAKGRTQSLPRVVLRDRQVGRLVHADLTHRSQSPMDPMIPYFTSGQITVEELLDGVKPSDLPLAFDALLVAARAMKLSNIEQTVLEIKGWEKEQRERQARQVVEEVRPVTEVSHQAGPRS